MRFIKALVASSVIAITSTAALSQSNSCVSDLNNDRAVDGIDMGLLLAQWGAPGTADFNASGSVEGADLGILLCDWGCTQQFDVVIVPDSVLDSVYYHQTSFLNPTKLVFPNLTTVNGYVYFHQTNNIVAVEFPMLQSTGRYFYFYGNISLENLAAPMLDSVVDYVYVLGNTSLQNLSICNLSHIYCDDGGEPYFYIANNTVPVDSSQPCFNATLHGTSLTTAPVTSFSQNTAIAGGAFTSSCGHSWNYGVCWSTKPNPTTTNFTAHGIGWPEFTANMTSLMPNTTYYVRAYSGSVYGTQVSFTTAP